MSRDTESGDTLEAMAVGYPVVATRGRDSRVY